MFSVVLCAVLEAATRQKAESNGTVGEVRFGIDLFTNTPQAVACLGNHRVCDCWYGVAT